MEKVYVIFGYLVRTQRMKYEISTASLAKKMGMTDSGIRGVELGAHRLPFHKVVKLSKILNINLEDIKNIS